VALRLPPGHPLGADGGLPLRAPVEVVLRRRGRLRADVHFAVERGVARVVIVEVDDGVARLLDDLRLVIAARAIAALIFEIFAGIVTSNDPERDETNEKKRPHHPVDWSTAAARWLPRSPGRGILRAQVPTDYVSELGASIRAEAKGSRFLCGEQNAIFVGHTPDDVSLAVNRAMGVAVEYYTRNVSLSSKRISETLIRDASLRVVVNALYGCSVRNEALEIDASDLENMFMRGHVLWFCEKAFRKDHRDYAAALMGLSANDFARWEEGWVRYCNR